MMWVAYWLILIATVGWVLYHRRRIMRRYTVACLLLSSASVGAGFALTNAVEYSVLLGFGLGMVLTVGSIVSYLKGY